MRPWDLTPIRILGIAGSLRRGSYNRSALRAATEVPPKGVTVETFQLGGIPPFDQDEERNPLAKVTELKRRIREANAILFGTPEYNWSVSRVVKHAIDWASRTHGDSAWNGKPAAIMGASTGAIGTARAQNHLRQILVYLNMLSIN
jgi:chromate reductase